MGCGQSQPVVVEPVFIPPDVLANIERLCMQSEFIADDRFIMGIDTQFRITDFLQSHPSCCLQVAQVFLQLLSPVVFDRLLIVTAEASPKGLFRIEMVGMRKQMQLSIFSRDFDDSCEPFVEVWFEKKMG